MVPVDRVGALPGALVRRLAAGGRQNESAWRNISCAAARAEAPIELHGFRAPNLSGQSGGRRGIPPKPRKRRSKKKSWNETGVCLEALFASVDRLPESQGRAEADKRIFFSNFMSVHLEHDLVDVPAGGPAITFRDGWLVMFHYRIDLYDPDWRHRARPGLRVSPVRQPPI